MRVARFALLAAVLGAPALIVSVPAPASAAVAFEGRTAEAILKDYDAIEFPRPDASKRGDRAYMMELRQKMIEAEKQRAPLILELLKADAKNERLAKMFQARWQYLMAVEADKLEPEVDQVLAAGPSDDLKKLARNFKAQSALGKADEIEDNAKKLAALKALVAEYGDTRVAQAAKGQLRQAEGVGKPFELKFTDAVSGKEMSIEGLKGKVVVVDFWATWCGPCIAEMPKMKKLYAEWKDKGVEFVGVSLDQPEETGKGLTKLKDYVAKNDIQWPQYYQGNYWQSEFSSSWGINSIPCVFVVAPDGTLYTTQGRGKLEEIVPKLLAQRDAKKQG